MKRSREPEEESSAASSPQDIASPHAYDMGPEPVPKLRGLDGNDIGNGASTAANTLRCTLHPQILTFTTFDEYDAHYNKQHVNRCHECHKNFPSDHVLSLHIEECHDSFVAALRDKGERTVGPLGNKKKSHSPHGPPSPLHEHAPSSCKTKVGAATLRQHMLTAWPTSTRASSRTVIANAEIRLNAVAI